MATSENLLQVIKLSAQYGNRTVFENLSFTVRNQEMIAVLGANGSGKSTLLRIIAGLQKQSLPQKNQFATPVFYYGKSVNQYRIQELAKIRCFIAQQEFCAWQYTVKEFVSLGFFCHVHFGEYAIDQEKHLHAILEQLQLTKLQNQRITCISGGEFQRCVLARALAQNPQVFLFDEVLSSLDICCQHQIMQMLQNLLAKTGKGIVISIHDINLASLYADKILLLADNTVQAFGSPSEVITQSHIEKAFGVKVSIVSHPHKNSPQIIV